MEVPDHYAPLGFEPAKIRNVDFWYHSPLRIEKTPSFKINRKINRWYDHGLGQGGNLIDFAILFSACIVRELIRKINEETAIFRSVPAACIPYNPGNRISILKEESIHSFALIIYLKERRIPLDIADKYCKEIWYGLNQREYYGIGFKNDGVGYEIRNAYFKTSSAPKGITTIQNQSSQVIVFEGFFDFLSFIAICEDASSQENDFVILNSVSFFEKARTFMEEHESIKLYLGRDEAGATFTKHALSICDKYSDESELYKHYKDFNDWLVNFGRVVTRKLQ